MESLDPRKSGKMGLGIFLLGPKRKKGLTHFLYKNVKNTTMWFWTFIVVRKILVNDLVSIAAVK